MAVGSDTLRTRPVRGKLADLEQPGGTTGNRGSRSLYFPGDLPTQDHWVAFRISKESKFRRDEVTKEDTQATIILPMPANLGTQYNAGYNVEAIGPAGATAAEIGAGVGGAVSGEKDPGEFIQSIKDAFEGEKGSFSGGLLNIASQGLENEVGGVIGAAAGSKGGTAGTLTGAGIGAAAAGAAKAGVAGAGVARNPHLATLFTGVNFRSHSFSYKFVPQSRSESDTLRGIIQKFKYHMAPGYTAGKHFFTYPENFDIQFHYPDYLFDIGASVLTAFDIQYHAEGASYYFDETNAPVSISITMNFQELTINTKDNIGLIPGRR